MQAFSPDSSYLCLPSRILSLETSTAQLYLIRLEPSAGETYGPLPRQRYDPRATAARAETSDPVKGEKNPRIAVNFKVIQQDIRPNFLLQGQIIGIKIPKRQIWGGKLEPIGDSKVGIINVPKLRFGLKFVQILNGVRN
jgi:hypothetical protein